MGTLGSPELVAEASSGYFAGRDRRGKEARTPGIWFTANGSQGRDTEKEVDDGHQRLVQTGPRRR
jgi:hypothetical protein